MADKSLIRVTDIAWEKLSTLPQEDVVTIDVEPKGCAGNSFRFGVKNRNHLDTRYRVDPYYPLAVSDLASLHVANAILDYQITPMKSEFTITVPGAGRCGCGKSFNG